MSIVTRRGTDQAQLVRKELPRPGRPGERKPEGTPGRLECQLKTEERAALTLQLDQLDQCRELVCAGCESKGVPLAAGIGELARLELSRAERGQDALAPHP